jgi:hypothetical protein
MLFCHDAVSTHNPGLVVVVPSIHFLPSTISPLFLLWLPTLCCGTVHVKQGRLFHVTAKIHVVQALPNNSSLRKVFNLCYPYA